MAEKDFQETFHQTRQPHFYDDSNSLTPNSEDKLPETMAPQPPTAPVEHAPITPAPRSYVQVVQSTPGIIAPKSYDGRTNPRVWLNHYETIAEANLWSEEVRYKKVIAYLKGAAEDWLANRRLVKPFTSWRQFRDALISRFTNTLDDLMLTQNIIRNRQKALDFDSYWGGKIGHIRLTSPNMSEKEVMNHMFTGLNTDLRMRVLDRMINRRCETAEELQALIKETNDIMDYEREEKSSNFKYRTKYHKNTYVETDLRPPFRKNDDERSRYSEKEQGGAKLQQLEKDIRQIKDGIEKIGTNHKPTSKGFDKGKEKARERKKVTCYNCNEEGHYSRDCPKKQKQGNEKKQN